MSSSSARWIGPAVAIWLVAVVYPVTGLAQTPVAHIERCIAWDIRDERLQAFNKCKVPAALMFMRLDDERVLEAEIAPGGSFDTGLSRLDSEGDWIYTACPAGHVPSVPFLAQYKDVIAPSAYQCERRKLIRRDGAGERAT